jgi:pantetheine-phosphate adenylyltransferase
VARASRVAVLGGSFDRLHVGHKALLDEAFRQADRVGIGVTTDAFLRAHPKPLARRIQPLAIRWRAVERYLGARYPRSRWWIVPLSDPWGRSIEAGVDVLVASEETARGAGAVNRIRRRRGLPRVRLRLVPLVRGTDLLPVSARRIRRGLIDAQGRRVRALTAAVAGATRTDLAPLRTALGSALGDLPLKLSLRPGGGSATGPKTDSRRTARNSALEAAAHAEYGVGLERGRPISGGRFTHGWLALADAEGIVGVTRADRAVDWPGAFARVVSARRSARAALLGRPSD